MSVHVRRAFAAAILALCACVALAAPAAAKQKQPRLVAPSSKKPVSGVVPFRVANARRVKRVTFFIDGKRGHVDRRRPFRFRRRGVLDTRLLSDGEHKIGVGMRMRGGRIKRRWRKITIANGGQPAPAAEAAPTPVAESSGNEPTLGPGPTYYVDGDGGNDANSGSSPGQAWRTLAKASGATLPAGANLLFKRGTTFSGTFTIAENGTFVASYGSGERPVFTSGANDGYNSACIVVAGNDNTLQDLKVERCGVRNGIHVPGDRNLVQRTYVTHNAAGIQIPTGADANRFLHNELIANDVMTKNTCGGDDDYGAYSFANEGGTNTEIGWNEIRGARAPSCDYGEDGSALEIFHGSGVRFHHNVVDDVPAAAEMSGASGARLEYNLLKDGDLIVQTADKFAGGNQGVVIAYNTSANEHFGWLGENPAGTVTSANNVYTGQLFLGATRAVSSSGDVNVPRSELDEDLKPESDVAAGAYAPGGLSG